MKENNVTITKNDLSEGPYIPASQNLPEITVKAVILSIILVVILTATNAYLGLKIGTTIAASIPAAVISMGILGLFKRSNILENNIVQTAASAGEAIIAGLAYILPAMIVIRFWTGFNYFETMWITLIGGILGVLFSIPVRRILLFHKDLRFPEGTAIGEVLKAGANAKDGLKYLIRGGLVGTLVSLCQTGFQVVSNSFSSWHRTSHDIIVGFGLGMDPALLAAGYIVGTEVAISTLIGAIIGWYIGVPVLSYYYPVAAGIEGTDAAISVWRDHIRYIGVGSMLIGGLWTLIILIKPIINGIHASLTSMKAIKLHGHSSILRTERDIPMNWVLYSTLALCIPMACLIYYYLNNPILGLGLNLKLISVVVCLLFVIVVGFVFSVVGAYFAGLVGSTNSPTSALTLATLILMSLLILALLGTHLHLTDSPQKTLLATAFAIMISSVISAASISNETIQDLKAGYMVGATPWKQQVMLILGVIVGALVTPGIFQLLYNAYGIAGVFPREGMDPNQMLAAPQASMMAALAGATFNFTLPWLMLEIGAVLGAACIAIDIYLRRYRMGLPVLAFGIGIYLPLETSLPFVIGGITSYIVARVADKRYKNVDESQIAKRRGLTLACGLVAGAALSGVVLAIPFAIWKSTDILRLVDSSFRPFANLIGIVITVFLMGWLYNVVCRQKN